MMIAKNSFNFKFFIVALFFSIVSLTGLEANEKCLDLEFSSNSNNQTPELISVETLDVRKWTKNLLKMLTETKDISKSEYISLDKYRNYHKAKIIVQYKNGIKCSFNGEVKIHGGTRNHRDNIKQTTSLRVKLFDGNILNTTHFALLLPKTRNGDNEIFGANLFAQLGYISPLTFYTNTSVNKIGSYKVIFQSREDKEILFFSKKRDGTVLSGNKTRGDKELSLARISYNYNFNENANYKNFKILEKLNLIYLLNFDSKQIRNFEGLNIDKIKEYEALVLSMGGGLEKEDRKFYFDNLKNNFEPIFNDTDIRILENNFFYIPKTKYKYKTIKNVINKINNINVDNFHKKLITNGLDIEKDEITMILQKIKKNVQLNNTFKEDEYINDDEISISNKILDTYLGKLFINEIGLIFYNKDNSFTICKAVNNCKKINLSEDKINTVLNSHIIKYNNYKYKYIFENKDILNNKKINKNKFSKKRFFYKKINIENFNIFYDEKIKINTNNEDKLIEIKFIDKNGKILIDNAFIDNWKFNITSDERLTTKLKKRINKISGNIDEENDIGCVTFSNVYFKNTTIFISNLGCKNSVHIINSSGDINELKGEYLSNDAFDIDFSDLKIKNARIVQSGSECFSLKTGNYNFKNLNIKDCIHGISIGENGKLEIDKFKSINSETAITVKDGSELFLKEALINKVDYCFKVFRKEILFNYSKINYNENLTSCNANKRMISKDEFSTIKRIF